jgi:hypothetical protein
MLGAGRPSLFLVSSNLLQVTFFCVGKTYSFAIFGLCVGSCELQMCMALGVAILNFFFFQEIVTIL